MFLEENDHKGIFLDIYHTSKFLTHNLIYNLSDWPFQPIVWFIWDLISYILYIYIAYLPSQVFIKDVQFSIGSTYLEKVK